MFLIVLDALLFFLLVLIAALRLEPQAMHHEEVKRRAKKGESRAQDELIWREVLPRLRGVRHGVMLMLAIGVTLVSIARFDWLGGSLVAFVLVAEVPALMRLKALQRLADKAFDHVRRPVVRYLQQWKWLDMVAETYRSQEVLLQSREDLIDIVARSHMAISADERRAIEGVLALQEKTVEEVMTPRSVIDTIAIDEVLAPIIVDQLYQTGHSRFPVIDGDIDHIVGMLMLRDAVDMKKPKSTVKVAMSERVYYIAAQQTLEQALHAFIRTRHHLFVVVNEYRETVGVLSLEDVLEALLGRKIVDEFDEFEDLRKVAEQNPRKNNTAQKAQDI